MSYGPLRLFRAFPGGGQYDVLWLLEKDEDQTPPGRVDIRLNRTGAIQVFSGDGKNQPITWDEYARADRPALVKRIADMAWINDDGHDPDEVNLPEHRSYQFLQYLLEEAVEQYGSCNDFDVSLGYIDSSGMGGGEDSTFRTFGFSSALTAARKEDFFGEPGYRFWVVRHSGAPLIAVEQTSGEVRAARSIKSWRLTSIESDAARALARAVVTYRLDEADTPSQTGPMRLVEGAWIAVGPEIGTLDIVAVGVEGPQDGVQTSLLVEGADGRVVRFEGVKPGQKDATSGADASMRIDVEGGTLKYFAPRPDDTRLVTGLHLTDSTALGTEDLQRAIRAKRRRRLRPSILPDEPTFLLEAHISATAKRLSAVHLHVHVDDGFLGWAREERRWESGGPIYREGPDLDSEDPDAGYLLLEDMSGHPVDPEHAGTMVALFDLDIPISEDEVYVLLGHEPLVLDRSLPGHGLPAIVETLLSRIPAIERRVLDAGGFDDVRNTHPFLGLRRHLQSDRPDAIGIAASALGLSDIKTLRDWFHDDFDDLDEYDLDAEDPVAYLRDNGTWPDR